MGLFFGHRLASVLKNIKRRFRRFIRVASKGVCTDVAAIDEQPRDCKHLRLKPEQRAVLACSLCRDRARRRQAFGPAGDYRSADRHASVAAIRLEGCRKAIGLKRQVGELPQRHAQDIRVRQRISRYGVAVAGHSAGAADSNQQRNRRIMENLV